MSFASVFTYLFYIPEAPAIDLVDAFVLLKLRMTRESSVQDAFESKFLSHL